MTRPIHCGRNCRPYRMVWNAWWPSWEEGFKCRVCGAIRVPYELDMPDREPEYVALLKTGLEFDLSLEK